jgi:hypothetical protein
MFQVLNKRNWQINLSKGLQERELDELERDMKGLKVSSVANPG